MDTMILERLGGAKMTSTKKIAISEERWKELGKLKEAGQTYDELIKEMIQAYNRQQLAEKVRKSREKSSEELTPIDEL